MAYISKESILKAYGTLSRLTADPQTQGATQKVSALRYFVALDQFFAKSNRNCDTKDSSDKEDYTRYVGEVVKVTDTKYTSNFSFPLTINDRDYNCGSNFYSVNVVKLSVSSPTETHIFPRRGKNPLIEVCNGVLIRDISLYDNLSFYLNNNRSMRVAFAIWLVRNELIDAKDYGGIKQALLKKYTKEFVEHLILEEDKDEFVDYLHFSQSISSLEELDIRAIIVPDKSVNLENIASKTNDKELSLCPLILYGPPGTGKTYHMQENYIKEFDNDNTFVTTFHQSFSYEDFVEGLKPLLDGYDSDNITYQIERGVFKMACERAALIAGFDSIEESIESKDRETIYDNAIKQGKLVLMCIDEINRANVSAVFGDLISLIEEGKRIGAKNELTVRLPYSKTLFGVPKNILIIGTMNTADRSIQLLDSALRRRFRFEELLPKYDILSEPASIILKSINAKIRCYIGKDSQIGHSYFIGASKSLDIFIAIRDKIIPLLQEYFYSDINKIRHILNENGKPEQGYFYIEDDEANMFYKEFDEEYEEGKTFFMLDSKLESVSTEEAANIYIKHLIP